MAGDGARLTLKGQEGPSIPATIPLLKQTNIIGRLPNAVDFIVEDPGRPNMISRVHAVIARDGAGQWQLEIRGSNGAQVDNQRCASGSTTPLKDGCVITFGVPQSRLTYTFHDDPAVVEAGAKHDREGANGKAPEDPSAETDDQGTKRRRTSTTESSADAPAASTEPTVPNAAEAILENLNEELVCCICQELMVHAHALSCSHAFCKACIASWMDASKGANRHTCPECRVRITGPPVHVRTLDNTIDKVAANALTPSELETRAKRQEEAKASGNLSWKPEAAAAPAPAAGAAFPFGVPPFGTAPAFGAAPFGGAPPFTFGAPAAGIFGGGHHRFGYDDDDDEDEDEDEESEGEWEVEHARSGRSVCRTCHALIALGERRWKHTFTREEYYSSTEFHHYACVSRG